MSDVSQPDEKLSQALKEIDELNSSLSKEKTVHAEKVCSGVLFVRYCSETILQFFHTL